MNDEDRKHVMNAMIDAMDVESDQDTCPMKHVAKAISFVCRTDATSSGPAQVSTPEYRTNYTTIFGDRVERGQA